MEQWERHYNQWSMLNFKPKILQSVDKQEDLTPAQAQQRVFEAHREIEKQIFMRDFFKALFEQQEADKGKIDLDTKEAQQALNTLFKAFQ